jgi:hypothetical protein
MKMALIDSKAYFRINPSCHASGVTPPKMKMALIDSKAYFPINRSWDEVVMMEIIKSFYPKNFLKAILCWLDREK